MIDLKLAKQDPSSLFDSPQAVVEHPELNHDEKVDILRSWAYDEVEMDTAEHENMSSDPARQNLLKEIADALHQLGEHGTFEA